MYCDPNYTIASGETHEALSISISLCASHLGIKGKDRADNLAKEATQKERQTPPSTCPGPTQSDDQNAILKIWQLKWKNQPKNGRYAIYSTTAENSLAT